MISKYPNIVTLFVDTTGRIAREWASWLDEVWRSVFELQEGAYGSMYGDNIGQTVTVSATDTYYEIGGGISGGLCKYTTFQNAKELLINKAGIYGVDYSISCDTAIANQEVESEVMINGAAQDNTSNHDIAATANVPITLGGTGILSLAVNDIVSLSVSNHTSTQNIIIEHVNLKLVRLGE